VGGADDDFFNAGVGNEQLFGDEGRDTAVFDRARSSYTITDNGDGAYTVLSADGRVSLKGIERLQFSDQVIELAPAAAPVQAAPALMAIVIDEGGLLTPVWDDAPLTFDPQIDSTQPLWETKQLQSPEGSVDLGGITCRIAMGPTDMLLDNGGAFTPTPHQDWFV
jgi:Ca2+-binding RTX toxin-like protein